jgi:hypothetical protein
MVTNTLGYSPNHGYEKYSTSAKKKLQKSFIAVASAFSVTKTAFTNKAKLNVINFLQLYLMVVKY